MKTLETRKSQNKKSKNRLIALIIVVILMLVGIVLLLTQSTWISAELGQSKAQYTLGLDYYQKKIILKHSRGLSRLLIKKMQMQKIHWESCT